MPALPPIIRINNLQLSELVLQQLGSDTVKFVKSEPAVVHAEANYPNGMHVHVTVSLDGSEQATLEALLQQIRVRITKTLTGE